MTKLRFIRQGQSLSIDPLSPSFAHGVGLFETMRLKARQLFFFQRHWLRIQQSAQQLGYELSCDSQAVIDTIGALVDADQLEDACVKLALIEDVDGGTQLLVYARPSTRVPESIALYYDADYPINAHARLAGHKTHNYMEHRLLHARARELGYYDQIRINTQGAVSETTVGNLFLVHGDSLSTAAEETGLLPGVARATILERQAVQLDAHITSAQLMSADAIFLTNSVVGVLPVHRIGFAHGAQQSYSSAIHARISDLQKQFETWQASESLSF